MTDEQLTEWSLYVPWGKDSPPSMHDADTPLVLVVLHFSKHIGHVRRAWHVGLRHPLTQLRMVMCMVNVLERTPYTPVRVDQVCTPGNMHCITTRALETPPLSPDPQPIHIANTKC
jgi:hypothetical protein